MKKILLYIGMLLPGFLFLACENDLTPYHTDTDRLNFKFEDEDHDLSNDTLTSFTFIYTPSTENTDTLWVDIATMGYVVDYPRYMALEQVPSGNDQAVAGTHYVAFNDPQLKEKYIIPANQNVSRIPIVFLRDPSLKQKEVSLKIRIAENENFQPGYPEFQTIHIHLSDILTRPLNWSMYVTYYVTGKYGKVKHQFMIDTGAEQGIKLDEEWFKKLVDPSNPDMGLTGYWNSFFANALKLENEARAAKGLKPLQEAPEAGQTEGVIVEFNMYDTSDF